MGKYLIFWLFLKRYQTCIHQGGECQVQRKQHVFKAPLLRECCSETFVLCSASYLKEHCVSLKIRLFKGKYM